MKMTVKTPPHHHPTPPQKLNVPTISAVTELIVPKHCCDHIEQITTVTVTFVQATFVLATFDHIGYISAVTDPILTKLYR